MPVYLYKQTLNQLNITYIVKKIKSNKKGLTTRCISIASKKHIKYI